MHDVYLNENALTFFENNDFYVSYNLSLKNIQNIYGFSLQKCYEILLS